MGVCTNVHLTGWIRATLRRDGDRTGGGNGGAHGGRCSQRDDNILELELKIAMRINIICDAESCETGGARSNLGYSDEMS